MWKYSTTYGGVASVPYVSLRQIKMVRRTHVLRTSINLASAYSSDCHLHYRHPYESADILRYFSCRNFTRGSPVEIVENDGVPFFQSHDYLDKIKRICAQIIAQITNQADIPLRFIKNLSNCGCNTFLDL